MSNRLDPVILAKLQAFSQRRRRLIIYRGVLTAVATLLATMMLIAFIDWLLVLPDGVRWGMSVAAYLAILVVEWRSCLRLLVFAPDPRRLARLVEHASPNLREDLLSAVELGGESGDAVYDSEQFRALLQSSVASRMEAINMDRLLPMQLVRRSIAVVAAIALVCIVIFSLTGFQFGTLMMRALLPMANLARVSKVHVAIVEPAPAEDRIPQGDTVSLIIDISGQRTNKAMLETFTKPGRARGDSDASAQRGPLFRDDPGGARGCPLPGARRRCHYEEIPSGSGGAACRGGVREDLYVSRILAAGEEADHGRKWRPRRAGRLGSGFAHEDESEDRQGGASHRAGQERPPPWTLVEKDGMLTGKISLNASGVYRVHLIGAGSGFENKFSPGV